MAAYEGRTGPDLDQFLGHKWTDWVNAIQSSDKNQKGLSDNGSSSKRDVEVARLRRDDMSLFGFRPATDRFYLVVCEHCGQLVKPQSLHTHYEKKHKNKRIKSPSSSGSSKSCMKPPAKFDSSNLSRHSGHGPSSHQKSPHSFRQKVSPKTELKPSYKLPHSDTEKGYREEKAGSKLLPPMPVKEQVSSKPDNTMKSNHNPLSAKSMSKTNSSLHENEVHERDVKHRHKTIKNGASSKHHGSLDSSHSMERKSERYNPQPSPAINSKSKRVYDTYHHPHHQSPQDSSSDSNLSSDISDSKHLGNEQRVPGKDMGVPLVMIEKTPMPGVRGSVKVGGHDRKRLRNPSSCFDPAMSPPKPKVPLLQNPLRDKSPSQLSDNNPPLPNSILPFKSRKDKKSIPLKAREYDPNRHCGVWLTEDNARCTRSLSCKVHPLSAKRGVPGRRKMFDELVQERNYEKQKLKEKKMEAGAPPSPATPVSGRASKPSEFVVPSPAPLNLRLSNDATTPPSASAASSQPAANRTKSISLFPKNFAAWHVDCWDDLEENPEESSKPQNPASCIHRHPQPLAACSFFARKVSSCQTSYSRKLEIQLEPLAANIKRFGTKTQKNSKPFSFTPLAPTSYREPTHNGIPTYGGGGATFTKSIHQSGAEGVQSSFLLPGSHGNLHNLTLSVAGTTQQRGSAGQKLEAVNHVGAKLMKGNLHRNVSTPGLNDQSHDMNAASVAAIRNRSKSEQAVNLMRRNVSAGTVGASWSLARVTDSNSSTSPHFFIDTNARNLSPSPLHFTSVSPNIVSLPINDTSADSIQTNALVRRDQTKLKKTSEKRKSLTAKSPKPFKASSKSAIAKYAVQQGLVNSELLDSGQITVQRPNGLNSVSSSVLLKPGSHSVTLSGNIGALTVTGEESGTLNAFPDGKISKRVHNMNSNNNFVTDLTGHQSVQNSPGSNMSVQRQNQVTVGQGVNVLPDNVVLQNDNRYLISPSLGQDGNQTIILDQYPGSNTNIVDAGGLDQQTGQTGASSDIFRLVYAPGEASLNCEGIGDDHGIQLNVGDVGQLSQATLGNVLSSVNKSVSSMGSAQLVTMDPSGNTNRTNDLGHNFLTQ